MRSQVIRFGVQTTGDTQVIDITERVRRWSASPARRTARRS